MRNTHHMRLNHVTAMAAAASSSGPRCPASRVMFGTCDSMHSSERYPLDAGVDRHREMIQS